MDYLEQNHGFLKEIGQRVQLKRNLIIYDTGETTITEIGRYTSAFHPEQLQIALKESSLISEYFPHTFIEDLAFLRAVSQCPEEVRAMAPLFYGSLFSQGRSTGIITEDLSKGGRYDVPDSFGAGLEELPEFHSSFKALLTDSDGHVSNYALWRIGSMINGKPKIFDFGEVPFYTCDRLPKQDIIDSLDKFILRIGYPL